mmetsp:Transcript_11662/g.15816  ORF Transcript_11662/g.15816 Transcript_11662/m.15816 type:complete len:226 (+) Transcript_11662:163-840(+)|eukprot:CAMPEP_0185572274 /NCGR_PEP_ID=MMETSP0434-20130131/4228_1 /TAXON_ID=626734 ORGANISM="Favella taraikaensis, Strain Fe Narragansett Bay" /NCGR_SAMPLE_ID=MMETSP0434 /ASSEMBLY_ACC=CAM_ASM_000379 /LENGTH=225 /DNA_ID=CAMNT_0028188083 /DNA_START=129 /DNA_END=806 /DNA_ORIENTATION=+
MSNHDVPQVVTVEQRQKADAAGYQTKAACDSIEYSSFIDRRENLTAKKTAMSINETLSYATEQTSQGMGTYRFLMINYKLWSVAIPSIAAQLVIMLVETISMMFVGRLNDTFAIAGVGLAIIFMNVTTVVPLSGLNSAISVLVAVAYGKKDFAECERVLQRGRILCLIATAPLFFIAISCGSIMTAMGVEEEVANHSQNYSYFFFFALASHCQFDCYRSYLNSTG